MSPKLIFEKLYDDVIARLGNKLIKYNEIFDAERQTLMYLAEDLGADVSDLVSQSDKLDPDTLRTALMPVAQGYVVAMLRVLFETSARKPNGVVFQNDRFRFMWEHKHFDWEQLPDLVDIDEAYAEVAFQTTVEVFNETYLFREPVILPMDGKNYEIFRDSAGLHVRLLSEV